MLLYEFDEESSWFYDREEDIERFIYCKVAFDYAGLIIASNEDCATVVRQQEDILFEYKRDHLF